MTTLDARVQAVEAYVKALRTAERSAVAWASGCLAPDVALHTGKEEIVGREHVAARLALVWPLTSVYLHGSWSAPQQDGDGLLVRAEFAAFGAAPRSETLRFAFNAVGQIARISQETVMPSRNVRGTIPVAWSPGHHNPCRPEPVTEAATRSLHELS